MGDAVITRERWRDLWRRLGSRRDQERLFAEVVAAYREKHRAYHDLRHLEDCLAQLDAHAALADAAAELELALWFHDAVYRPRAADNEAASARWALRAVAAAGLPEDLGGRIAGLILATQHMEEPAAGDGRLGADARLIVDVDLSILGRSRQRFDGYERDVRREYRWVPRFLYRKKRAEILRWFLDRPRIFLTEPFFVRYEQQARANIERSLVSLRPARG